MSAATLTKVMAVIPLSEYRQLKANESTKHKLDNDDDEEEDEGQFSEHHNLLGDGIAKNHHQHDLPSALELVVHCVPARARRSAILLLHYLARLNGRFKYDADTGEISINNETIPQSNLSEILRILLTRKPVSGKQRETVGMRPFLSILATTALPSNLIVDDHWKLYLLRIRSKSNKI